MINKEVLLNKLKKLQSLDRRNKLIIAGVIFILLSLISIKLFFSNSMSQGNKLQNLKSVQVLNPDKLKKQSVKESISNLKPYENKIIKIALDKENTTSNFSETKKYSDSLTSILKTATKNLQEVKKVSSPAETLTYKNNIINEYSNFIAGLNHEIKYVNNSNSDEMSAAQTNYNNFISIKQANQTELTNIEKTYSK